MTTATDKLLRDEFGQPLPLRMSRETWEDLKALVGQTEPSPLQMLMGIAVELDPNIARGTVLQADLDFFKGVQNAGS